MEIAGREYLYNLALISITYGGFAALFTLFRERLNRRMAAYDAFLIRAVIQKGFIVTGCALLPPLLASLEISHAAAWQISSFAAGFLQALWLWSWLSRRMRVRGLPTSRPLVINLSLQVAVSVYLLLGASGYAYAAGPAHFMIGVTAILFLSAFAYQEAVVVLLESDAKRAKK